MLRTPQQLIDQLDGYRAAIAVARPAVSGRLTRVVGLAFEAVGCRAPIGSLCAVETQHGEVEAEVVAVITELGASSMADMGRVMGAANKRLAGRADGALVAALVKKRLASG